MRLGKTLIAWLLWFGACVGSLKGQAPRVHTVLYTPAVLHQWALLYREFHTEFMGCLYGRVHGDSLTVVGQILADILPQDSRQGGLGPSSDPPPCLDMDSLLLGVAHSHPMGCVKHAMLGDCEHDTTPPCYESPQDRFTFQHTGLRLSIVVCGYGHIVDFTREGQTGFCVYRPEELRPDCLAADSAMRETDP